jgi:hypothetical protein
MVCSAIVLTVRYCFILVVCVQGSVLYTAAMLQADFDTVTNLLMFTAGNEACTCNGD